MNPIYLCDYTPKNESNLFRLSWKFRDCTKTRYFTTPTAAHFFSIYLLNNPRGMELFDCINNCFIDTQKTRPFQVTTSSFIKLVQSFEEKNLLESKINYFIKVYQG